MRFGLLTDLSQAALNLGIAQKFVCHVADIIHGKIQICRDHMQCSQHGLFYGIIILNDNEITGQQNDAGDDDLDQEAEEKDHLAQLHMLYFFSNHSRHVFLSEHLSGWTELRWQ